MPELLNTNPHVIYVENPGADGSPDDPLLPPVPALSFVSASGAYADRLRETPGVVDLNELSTDERRRIEDEVDAIRAGLYESGPGEDAYPVTDHAVDDYPTDQLKEALAARGLSTEGKKSVLADRLAQVIGGRLAEPSGQHITGRDSGVPVASDAEPTPHKDGTGNDPHDPVTAVERGVVERGDAKPQGEQDNPQAQAAAGDLDGLNKRELKEIADERGVTVTRTDGKDGDPRKEDYVAALSTGAPAQASGEQLPPAPGEGSTSDKPDTGPPTPTFDELEDFSKDALVEAAEVRGLDTEGSKSDLVERLREAGVGQAGPISTESGAALKRS